MMNGCKIILYFVVIMLAVVHHSLWIRGVPITIGLYEHSRVMLEGAQHVWTQSAVGECISITSLSSLNSWIEIIGIPTVILVWYSESKINRSGNITNRPCQYMLESHLNANRTLLPTGVNYKWTKVDVLRVHITSWCCDHGIQNSRISSDNQPSIRAIFRSCP